ncbi:hypothetical protein [Robertkochia sediminum]|uniref:hypothetical protein n=1 Tax=Robertkochia sediminum TaxID=2785326 RepID=UPI0019316728|nr:hypothetical protein [Robertkochia sediminum]MBL7472527.1 hypothetical protein [Robertkochia sediminum]
MRNLVCRSIFAMVFLLALPGCSNDDDGSEMIVVDAGTISGGPFEFCVDGTPDNVSGITLSSTGNKGSNSTWVITDAEGNILGLPPTTEALEGVDFDGAGAGLCLIWYLTYEGEITGAVAGNNAADITGNFDLSNAIEVQRRLTEAGDITGGPFNFTVDDTPDFVSGIGIASEELSGSNSSWVITDDQGNILGLPPTVEDLEAVDFNAAGPGVCLIWYLRFEDGLEGAEAGANAADLEGCFDLSNPITVNRLDP